MHGILSLKLFLKLFYKFVLFWCRLLAFAGNVAIQVAGIAPILYSSLCTKISQWSFGVGLLVCVSARKDMMVTVIITAQGLCNIFLHIFGILKTKD